MGLIGFIVFIVVEIWSIMAMSQAIGGLATLVLLAAGFIFGLKLMRAQGLSATMQAMTANPQGDSPMNTLADGIVNAFAGILFMVPGFVSDIVALIILLPLVRRRFARYLMAKGQFQMGAFGSFGGFRAGGFSMSGFSGPSGGEKGNIYEHEGSTHVEEPAATLQSPNKKEPG